MGDLDHHCHARGCTAPVRPELLMCIHHWRMVPIELQRAVWRAYRPGQCRDKQPSDAWFAAADAAIRAVWNLEQAAAAAAGTLRTLRLLGVDLHQVQEHVWEGRDPVTGLRLGIKRHGDGFAAYVVAATVGFTNDYPTTPEDALPALERVIRRFAAARRLGAGVRA